MLWYTCVETDDVHSVLMLFNISVWTNDKYNCVYACLYVQHTTCLICSYKNLWYMLVVLKCFVVQHVCCGSVPYSTVLISLFVVSCLCMFHWELSLGFTHVFVLCVLPDHCGKQKGCYVSMFCYTKFVFVNNGAAYCLYAIIAHCVNTVGVMSYVCVSTLKSTCVL